MRALIVDDDELSLDLLQGVLTEMGHSVELAHDGQEAWRKLRDGSIHLVVTDWDMPSMNGLELCREIRKGDFDGYVYVIMLTGKEGGDQKIEGSFGGADAFLTKPLNPDELLVSLKNRGANPFAGNPRPGDVCLGEAVGKSRSGNGRAHRARPELRPNACAISVNDRAAL